MKLVWKASGCPSFLEMTKSVDLEYNGWSNWGFTFDKFYLPLIQGALNIYLFGTFIRNESGQTKLYQFGGAENDFYSLFLNEEYEGGFGKKFRSIDSEKVLNELLPFIEENFHIKDGYIVAKDSLYSNTGDGFFEKLTSGSSRYDFKTQLVFDLPLSSINVWKSAFEDYLDELGRPMQYLLKGTKSYSRLVNKIEDICSEGSFCAYYRPTQPEFYLIYKSSLQKELKIINGFGGVDRKSFVEKLNLHFESGHSILEKQLESLND